MRAMLMSFIRKIQIELIRQSLSNNTLNSSISRCDGNHVTVVRVEKNLIQAIRLHLTRELTSLRSAFPSTLFNQTLEPFGYFHVFPASPSCNHVVIRSRVILPLQRHTWYFSSEAFRGRTKIRLENVPSERKREKERERKRGWEREKKGSSTNLLKKRESEKTRKEIVPAWTGHGFSIRFHLCQPWG